MKSHCLYCHVFLLSEMTWTKLFFPTEASPLCKTCLERLSLIKAPRCEKCSRSLAKLSKAFIKGTLCTDCYRWEEQPQWKGVLKQNTSLYEYNDFTKEMLARFKYRGDYVLAKAFSHGIRNTVSKLAPDYVVPIPLSEERLLERGFNQSTALALEAGFTTAELLMRVDSEKQSKKSRQERVGHTDVFSPVKDADIKGKNILLIDDIYTTGSTLHHAAKTLKQAGAAVIHSFTLVRS